uniref:NACHT domain-containing protein n=1 Tax=Mycena chlorophos TaxID=658473 RepID=A0ABQ0M1H4_MYCCL|nr:predicted protein [Mycena chlorophos]
MTDLRGLSSPTISRNFSLVNMALYAKETLNIGPIYGGTGGAGGAGGEQGGPGGTGQGNTFTVNAQNAVFNNAGVPVQDTGAILDWFSPLNFYPRHQAISQTRAQNTGSWLLEHSQFKGWKKSQGAWLWCKGDPGVGKTVLSSLVIDHLISESSAQVAFVYLNHKETEAQTPSNILAAIWSQFMLNEPLPPKALDVYKDHIKKKTKPGRKQLVDLLAHFLGTCSQAFIIVDALDECPEDNTWALLDDLNSLGTQVNILFTSRPNIQISRSDEEILTLGILADETDVHQFIAEFIRKSPALSKQVKQSPEVKSLIHAQVSGAARGMFLLARLHLEALQKDRNIGTLKQHLSALPQTLEETYEEAILRVQSQPKEDAKLAHRALLWILYAKRPLQPDELEVAVSIELWDSLYNKDFQHAIQDILAACAGLIALDVEASQIRIVHYTAQELLPKILQYQTPHKTIAVALLSLLNGLQFQPHLSTGNTEELFQQGGSGLLEYAGYCLLHAQEDPQTDDILDLLQTFLEKGSLWANMMHYSGWSRDIKIWRAAYNWQKQHTPLYLAAGSNLLDVVKIYIKEGSEAITYALESAAEYGSRQVLEYLLHLSYLPTYEAFYAACSSENLDVVRLLVEAGAPTERAGHNALTAASFSSCTIVEYLITLGLDPNLVDLKTTERTPLQAACLQGKLDIAQLLIDHGAHIDLPGGGDYGSPLQAACLGGSIETVQLLIDKGADVNQIGGGHYGSPLEAACAGESLEIVQSLIYHGANINLSGVGYYDSALQAACAAGNLKIVQLLIDSGAAINQIGGGDFGSPLQAACAAGSIEVVQLLISHSISFAQLGGGIYSCPLHAACVWGRVDIVKFLIAQGADIHMIGLGKYGSPLQAACAGANLETAQLLLVQGADVNLPGGGEYGSPLQAAVSAWELGVVEFLITQGAQVNQPTEGLYTTALDAAYYYGQNKIWNHLLSHGADPLAALSTDILR